MKDLASAVMRIGATASQKQQAHSGDSRGRQHAQRSTSAKFCSTQRSGQTNLLGPDRIHPQTDRQRHQQQQQQQQLKPPSSEEQQQQSARQPRTLHYETKYSGKVASVKDSTYGFIQNDSIEPSLEEVTGDLYFSLKTSSCGFLEFQRGDIVRFCVSCRQAGRPTAVNVHITKCTPRRTEKVESCIQSLVEKANTDAGLASDSIVVAMSCLPACNVLAAVCHLLVIAHLKL